MKPITLFSWGYWGWGTSAKQLVKAVDAVERCRGFKPPIFVEIRLRRSGRAVDFQGDKFERLLGPKRYRWMKSLGNLNIRNPKSKHLVRIADPESADELLEFAVDEAANNRRIIFYCGCPSPMEGRKIRCHRSTVARLVVKAAKKCGVGTEVIEWPGGSPAEKMLSVPAEVLRKVKKGGATIPLKRGVDFAEMAGVPWCSIVRLESDGQSLCRLSGPAIYKKGRWCLPVMTWWSKEEFSIQRIRGESAAAWKFYGYEPRTSF